MFETEMRCCSHVPEQCYVRVVQETPSAPPKIVFQGMIRDGVMELSFKAVIVRCRACYLLTGDQPDRGLMERANG